MKRLAFRVGIVFRAFENASIAACQVHAGSPRRDRRRRLRRDRLRRDRLRRRPLPRRRRRGPPDAATTAPPAADVGGGNGGGEGDGVRCDLMASSRSIKWDKKSSSGVVTVMRGARPRMTLSFRGWRTPTTLAPARLASLNVLVAASKFARAIAFGVAQ